MTQPEFDKLKPGDIISSIYGGTGTIVKRIAAPPYTMYVIAIGDEHRLASNPDAFILIEQEWYERIWNRFRAWLEPLFEK